MGGKGQRRREKNYLDAHGGGTRLPPPPNAKLHDALPSKLRKLIQLRNSSATKHGATEVCEETGHGKRKEKSSSKKNPNINASQSSKVIAKLEDDIMKTKNNIVKEKRASDSSSANVKKIKGKKISVKDLRFEDLGQIAKHSKRKERKKVYLKVRKNKSMKVKVKEELDFPGRETIVFGEVVMAPPKLSLPKDSNIKESQSSTVFAKLGNDIEKTKSDTVMENSVNSESSSAEVKKSNRKRNVLEDIRADDFGQYAMGKERNEEHLKDIRNKYPKVKMNDGKSFPGRGNAIEKAPPKLLPKVPKRSMDASTESLRQKSIQLYRNHRRWDSRPGLEFPSFAGTATL